MPPRKSEPARQSDTTTASFALVEEVEATEAPALPASSSARVPTAAAAASSTPATMMEVDRPSESAPPTDKERKEGRDSVTIEDLTLPKSIITRLAKGVLPPNTQIQTNAVLAMSKSATVFINHLANAANEHTQNANKKTIMPNDVFAALEDIEFPFLRERLEAEFKKFNEVQTTKRNTYRRKVAAAKAGKPAPTATATTADSTAPGPNAGDPNVSTLSAAASGPAAVPRSAKKQKTNGPDDSRMDVDGGANDEERDASDPETEPEQEHDDDDDDDDDDEDDDGPEEEDDDDDEDEDEDRNGREMREDALEERDAKDNDRDEALDDGDSD